MAWLQIEAELGGRDPEPVETTLEELGAVAITLSDAGDHPLLEPKPGETPLWPSISLTALFTDDADPVSIQQALEPHVEPGSCETRLIEEQDWQAGFEQELKPLRFGKRLWVLPTDELSAPPDAVTLRLTPGLAFGTGTHPTTAMCLKWLDGLPLSGTQVLDFGCGSGILGLAAAALGAESVTMTDIDEQALSATRDNAARNQLQDRIQVTNPQKTVDSVHHNVLLANILSNTLIELGPQLNGFMRPGAHLALAGILVDQAEQVAAAWADWADLQVSDELDGWVLLTGMKHELANDTQEAEN